MYMTELNNKVEDDDYELFEGGDFVFTQKDGKFVGGGYKIKTAFLEGGMPIMTTINDHDSHTGGKVSSPFENLAVPAGLFYINTRVPKKYTDKTEEEYKPHQTINDDIMDKLYSLVEVNKKQQRKTKKIANKLTKSDKRKTRRHK